MASDPPENDYILHNESETTRLAFQHRVIRDAMNGRLVLAPIDLYKAPLQILDSCTADGLWIRDLQSSLPPNIASQHAFIGTDIEESYFPTDPPGNTTYHVQDVNKPWPEQWNEKFDLVHQRLSIAVSGDEKATQSAVRNLISLVKPGGWIQIVDLQNWTADGDGPVWKDFTICLADLISAVGSSLDRVEHVKNCFEGLGLIDVEETSIEANYGTRDDKPLEAIGKKSGLLTAQSILSVATTFPQEILTLPKARVSDIKAGLEKEMSTDPVSAHWRYKVVWGRKPE
ncbi:hypothetical protein BDV96DRAFT_644005 [Lophiotrema nucula]|uniref:Methyltransferase SirN-like protein n=1 Tax=Lophiotrema nucula TaxID=690887 RepID=A0A6A5ZEX8_9PLEO|nr:hypothetical protein BDV96DRAFT_644005 [Lophiotrema nucula]